LSDLIWGSGRWFPNTFHFGSGAKWRKVTQDCGRLR
jgi:hypothetical protein